MARIRGIIPFYGLKIQVSEILFHLPRNMACWTIPHEFPLKASMKPTGMADGQELDSAL